MEHRTGIVDGIPMVWLEAGNGFPIVFVHGIPTSPYLWRHVIPRIQGARCIAWEMVGYGTSGPVGKRRDISVSRQADYLAAFLRSQRIERAVLAGHDLGGGVVQILAVRNPRLCAGLMLTNAIAYDSWPIPSVKALRATSGVWKRLPAAALKPMLSVLFARGHDTRQQARQATQVHWPNYAGPDGPSALARQVRSLDVTDTLAVQDDLKRLQVPAQIVWGVSDQFQKIKYGERLANDLAAKVERLPNGKHFTPEDHPDTVAQGVRHVLDAVLKR